MSKASTAVRSARGARSSKRLPVTVAKKPSVRKAVEAAASVPVVRIRSFYPPNILFPPDPPTVGSEVFTFFLSSMNSRSASRYKEKASKFESHGFRTVFVGPLDLLAQDDEERLVGRVAGDHFSKAAAWAQSNVLDELHQQYLRRGGGTEAERKDALSAYRSRAFELKEQRQKLVELEQELEKASKHLVLIFGRQNIPMDVTRDGEEHEVATYDPSYACETVYWKKRGGKDFG